MSGPAAGGATDKDKDKDKDKSEKTKDKNDAAAGGMDFDDAKLNPALLGTQFRHNPKSEFTLNVQIDGKNLDKHIVNSIACVIAQPKKGFHVTFTNNDSKSRLVVASLYMDGVEVMNQVVDPKNTCKWVGFPSGANTFKEFVFREHEERLTPAAGAAGAAGAAAGAAAKQADMGADGAGEAPIGQIWVEAYEFIPEKGTKAEASKGSTVAPIDSKAALGPKKVPVIAGASDNTIRLSCQTVKGKWGEKLDVVGVRYNLLGKATTSATLDHFETESYRSEEDRD